MSKLPLKSRGSNSAEPMRPTVAGGWVRKGRDLDISAERAVVVCFSRRDV